MSRPAGIEDSTPSATASSTERNVDVVRRMIADLNAHNLSGVLASYDDAMEWLDLPMEKPILGKRAVGAFLAELLNAFPDLRYEPLLIVGDEDRVVVRFEMHGTHRATYAGLPATGKLITIPSVSVITLRSGKIVSDHCYFDIATILRQVGLMPSLQATFSPPGRAVLWLAVKRRQVAATAAVALLSGLLARAIRGRRR
ncbi:MAG TPA: ester cyclase [Thermomicrobiaceae bacterium]|nr:ester cyclase [Thermomicrobiaceae bacterium]